MSTDRKKLIKNKNSGKNLEENSSDYLMKLAETYYEQSLVHCAMKYYTLYEQIFENEMHDDGMLRELHSVNHFFDLIFTENFCKQKCEEELNHIRAEIIKQMDVLTSYTDQLMIYEYVLNRIEFKFQVLKPMEDDTVFAQELMQYVFGVKDNFVINERIKEVVGQLPVRMARTRFYELLKNSITLYKDSEKSSLNTFLYMIRTSAMLYKPDAEGMYFTDIKDIVDVFRSLDYENIGQEDFYQKEELLKETASKIREISDFLVSVQEIVNNLYVYVLTKDIQVLQPTKQMDACFSLLREIRSLFQDGAADSIPESTTGYLYQLEGLQETLALQLQKLEGVVEAIGNSHGEKWKESGLYELYEDILKAGKLMSTSIFVMLDTEEEETADEDFIASQTETVLKEFSMLFHENPMCIVRAVIANTLDKMPVFFNSTDEIMDYINTSLSMCKDEAEKQASKEILKEIMVNA